MTIPSSAAFNRFQSSIAPAVGATTLSITGAWPTGQQPSITVSWTQFTLTWPDGTVDTIAAGNIVWGNPPITTNGTWYVAAVYVDYISGSPVVKATTPQTTIPVPSDEAIANADHHSGINATSNFYATVPTQGGTGGGGGGGIKGNTCPALWVPIKVREHSHPIPAAFVTSGMHLRGANGWKKALTTARRTAELTRVTLRGKIVGDFDAHHRWLAPDGRTWLQQSAVTLDTALWVESGDHVCPDALELVGEGLIALITVEGGMYMIDDLMGHNFPINTF